MVMRIKDMITQDECSSCFVCFKRRSCILISRMNDRFSPAYSAHSFTAVERAGYERDIMSESNSRSFKPLVNFHLIYSDEGLTLETPPVFESFTVTNLPYRPCG